MSVKTQIAALPLRRDPRSRLEVCLVTTRETGRWTVPKGWPMKGLKPWEAAAQEAYEEAGVRGEMGRKPQGKFLYWKRKSNHFVLVEVTVYPLHVEEQLGSWPEKDQRRRVWMSLDRAAEEVLEPGLVAILQQLADADSQKGGQTSEDVIAMPQDASLRPS